MFHKHEWETIIKTYAEASMQGRYFDIEDLLKIRCGVTTVLFKCKLCNKFKREEFIGKEVGE